MKELLRKDIKIEETWDLTSIFKNDEEFYNEFQNVEKELKNIKKYQNKLKNSAKDLLLVLRASEDFDNKLETLYVYSHLKNDQDTTEAKYIKMHQKAYDLYVKASSEWSFLQPEIMALDENILNSYINQEEGLKKYKFFFEKLNTKRPYTLDKETEKIITLASGALSSSSETFSALNNTDVKFDPVKNKNGEILPLNFATYGKYMESKDRVLRKNTFKSMYKFYKEHINTLASTLSGNLKANKYYSDTHKYKSTRQNAMSNNYIPEEVYDNLIDTVNKNLHVLHKYHELQKKVFGEKELRLYDRSVSMVDSEPLEFDFETAKNMVIEAVKCMGEDYVENIKKAFEERWIDIRPNKGKRSGAYSSGGYNTKPYILLNYDDTLNSVHTLIHELGHSMHSYYTRKNQDKTYGSYSIFVAEVASTCNEALLSDYLYKKYKKENNKNAMLTILNHELSSYVGTLFRQVMFSEFEYKINTMLAKGEVLTAEYLNKLYYDLVKKYHGNALTYDDEIMYEWSRVPHFYYNYYVYQYATGFSAARALSSLILENKENAKKYIEEFLSKGNSNYPIEILKNAGVDMRGQEAITRAIREFDKKIDEFEKLYFEK